MTEEEKKAAAEAEAKAKADADALKKNADVEALLKQERDARLKAESELAETRRKSKEAYEERKRKRVEAGQPPEDEDEPVTLGSIQKVLEEERTKTRKLLMEERAVEIAQKIAGDPSIASLTLEVWKNRTLSGTIEEQLSEAHAIATYKQSRAVQEEMKRALAGKETVSKDGTNAQRKTIEKDTSVDIAVTDKSVYQGMEWDKEKQAYKKKLPSGKMFYSKPAQGNERGKRWVE